MTNLTQYSISSYSVTNTYISYIYIYISDLWSIYSICLYTDTKCVHISLFQMVIMCLQPTPPLPTHRWTRDFQGVLPPLRIDGWSHLQKFRRHCDPWNRGMELLQYQRYLFGGMQWWMLICKFWRTWNLWPVCFVLYFWAEFNPPKHGQNSVSKNKRPHLWFAGRYAPWL